MNKKNTYNFLLIVLLFIFANASSHAEYQTVVTEQHFESHTVRYNIFSSTFIQPEIAKLHNIKRSAYENLINVSVSPKGEYGAYPAHISGHTKNLLQQQKPLEFIEIKENNATYYIAPISISGEDNIHFYLNVKPNNKDDILELNFTRKLYSEK